MPRPSINLEPFQAEISNLYQTGTNPRAIADIISNRYGIKVGERTIKSRLSIWGSQKSNRTASRDTVLHARIKVLIYQVGLSDEEILHTLKLEGYDITARSLKYIRHQKGFLRRLANPVADQAQVENVLNQLRTDLATGQIEGYGIGFLHQHFKNQGFLIGRDRLFSMYKQLAPAAVHRRLQDLQRHRGAYLTPGPNFIWSIDGYLKLAPYGIEVYAAIDAYSRYIIWVYVGISSRTAVSVLRQFLDTLAVTQQQPRLVRSDRGTETVLLAEAQYKLQQSLHPDINIRDCYLYGTSTANQRIEAWWLQLTRGMLYRYQEYFYALQEEGKFSMDQLGDRIALYAIYMPLIRTQITSFVRTWNQHRIRKQSNRPYSVPGKPWMNYHFPPTGVENEGIQFNMDLFKQLQQDVKDWDTDQYLPPDTYAWTRNQLLELLFDPQQPPSAAGDHALTPFRTIYLDLRARIQAHIETGSQPILSLSQPPTGAFRWDPRLNPNGTEKLELVREVEVGYDQDQVGELEELEN
ncbi:uncharacterized protein BDV14DRAFT_178267 [Aspergillus stella-maris]|uniref:uncharacterized protein n=1 Tax=Aspergillus stella-maris TaxID=1810926 RepID=UPI003CCE2D7F